MKKTFCLFLILTIFIGSLTGCSSDFDPLEQSEGVPVLDYVVFEQVMHKRVTYYHVVVKDRYMPDERLIAIANDIASGQRAVVYIYCEGDCFSGGATVAELHTNKNDYTELVRRIPSWVGAPSETTFARYGSLMTELGQLGANTDEIIEQHRTEYGMSSDAVESFLQSVAPYTQPIEITG